MYKRQVKIEKADIHEYNVDSLYEVASLTQKQKVISSAVSRAENVANDLGLSLIHIYERTILSYSSCGMINFNWCWICWGKRLLVIPG